MAQNKTWTQEEINYLVENWGTVNVKSIAKKLGRTENAVLIKKCKLRLGPFCESGDYVAVNQLSHVVTGSNWNSYRMISWVKNRGFPLRYQKIRNNSMKVVRLDEWWSWAEKNQEFLDFSKFEKNSLGAEPEWVGIKRKRDIDKKSKIKGTPWTKSEDEMLKHFLSKQCYTYPQLSLMLKRSCGAIQRRVCDLGIKDRPIKADNHRRWTDEEKETLLRMIKKGCNYLEMSEVIGRSTKAIRGTMTRWYNTERLDTVRERMEAGE